MMVSLVRLEIVRTRRTDQMIDLEPASSEEGEEDVVDTTGGRGIKNEKMNQLLQSSEGKDSEVKEALESAV